MSTSPYTSKSSMNEFIINSNTSFTNLFISSTYKKIIQILCELKQNILTGNIINSSASSIKDINWILKNLSSMKLFGFVLNEQNVTKLLEKINVDYSEIKEFIKEIRVYNKEIDEINKANVALKAKMIEYSQLISKNFHKNESQKTDLSPDVSNTVKSVEIFKLKNQNPFGQSIKINPGISYTDEVKVQNQNRQLRNHLQNNFFYTQQENKIPLGPQKRKLNYINLSLSKKPKFKGFNVRSYDSSLEFNSRSNYSSNSPFTNVSQSGKFISKKFPKFKFYFNGGRLKRPLNAHNDYNSLGKVSGSSTSVTDFDKTGSKISVQKKRNLSNLSGNKLVTKPTQAIDTLVMINDINTTKLFDYTNFNIFELCSKVGKENVFPIIGKLIFKRLNLLELINEKNVDSFLFSLARIYKNDTVFYHNSLHGVDVSSSVSCYIFNTMATNRLQRTEILSIIVAALGHDLAHPGVNNAFLINSKNALAFTYNDTSVLENFHCSQLFKVLNEPELNIFDNYDEKEFKSFKKTILASILATDMAFHKDVVSKFESYTKEIKEKNNDASKEKNSIDKQPLLNALIHFADLAHNTKRFDVSCKWVDNLNIEFWKQGDREKELNIPVSPLCDRYDVNTPKSQIGFIQFVIIPSFKTLCSLFPELIFTSNNAENNLDMWKKELEEGEYDKKREYLNIKM